MELRILNGQEVREALPMAEAIEGMKEAYQQLSAGKAAVPLRTRIEVPKTDGISLFMPALLHDSEDLALKVVSVFPGNLERGLPTIHAVVIVLDAQTGTPIALLEGGALTAVRTGAASGAATDVLARSDAHIVAIFGSGVQARTQLEAVCTVRQIDRAWVFSLDGQGARTFVGEMAGRGPIPKDVRLADSPAEAIAEAEVICTATTSRTPVFEDQQLRPGTHINAIGSYTPEMQEIPSETIARSLVVVDSREAVLAETGDLVIPMNEGLISEAHIHAELGEIIGGAATGRMSPGQITLFKSVGIAVQDAMAAGRALRKAEQLDLGRLIEF